MFEWTNPLHPDLFPGIKKMEAEIVSMVVKLLNGDPKIQCGTMTTGGTESILMAIRVHREWARDVKGIDKPNMVFPVTAHAAFDKACNFFNIEPIHAPLDPKTFAVDIKKMKKLINRNTIMIVGSFPNFPYGTVDDIASLSKIAVERGIGLHVDCCLGSFIALFSEHVGNEIPEFDFRLPGVTSISLDTHKYGFTPKGSSLVLYQRKELRDYQFFVQPTWPGGIYASPSMPGSKAGTVIATSWAILMHFGKEGYRESCKKILSTRQKIEDCINNSKNRTLEVLGKPPLSVIAFSSKVINIYRVHELLAKKGWALGALQYPAAIHISITYLTDGDQFCQDLNDVVNEVLENPKEEVSGSSAFYGVASKIPDRSIVSDFAKVFMDTLYKV